MVWKRWIVPQIREIVSFKEELYSYLKQWLKESIKTLKKSKKLFAFVDKKSNIYQIQKDEYSNLTTGALISTYNKDGTKIIQSQEVVNRVFLNGSNNCFVTLRDFCHLPNPAKNKLDRNSKSTLDTINVSLQKLIKSNQWKKVVRSLTAS